MNKTKLDDVQREKVATWISEGLKLAEIQKRLDADFGLRLTYIDVRFLVDDLKLTPKDPELPKPPAATPPSEPAKTGSSEPTPPELSPTGKVSVAVDKIARPGALVSGKVSFSDGNSADWHLDQTGRLGLVPHTQGYRPAPGDIQQFQAALEVELSKAGF